MSNLLLTIGNCVTLVSMSTTSFEKLKIQIQEKLTRKLPGVFAHQLMAPYSRLSHSEIKNRHPHIREAGVMMLLYEKNNVLYFSLIKRNAYEGVHSAQVSFPGGKREPNEILSQTAIRETQEEIGIQIHSNELLGALTPIYIPPSKILVHPFISWHRGDPQFKKDDREVDYIIEVKLDELLDDNKVAYQDMNLGKTPNSMIVKKVPYFDLNDEIVWGATAMILSEAKEFLKSIGLPFS